MKKVILSFALLIFGVVVLAGCEEIKQVVSDIAEEEIETQVNEMLGLTEEEELFQLPEAKRYEEFKFEDTDEKTSFSLAVIEPKVEILEYAQQMIETFAVGFEEEISEEDLQAAIDQVKEQKEWTYEYDGDVYKVNFEEILAEDGLTIDKWTIAIEVLYAQAEQPEQPEQPEVVE